MGYHIFIYVEDQQKYGRIVVLIISILLYSFVPILLFVSLSFRFLSHDNKKKNWIVFYFQK